jgi:copper chaperone
LSCIKPETESMNTIDLSLPGMSCGHCVKTITATAQRLDPGAQVQADLATRRVTVQTTAGRDALVAALAAAGYRAAA